MRIVTRPDFDGVVCAALISDAEALDQPIAAGVLLEDGMSISRLAANLSDTLTLAAQATMTSTA